MSSQKLRRVDKSNSINNKIIDPLKDGAFVIGPGQMATPLTKQIANGVKLSSRKKRKHTDSQSDYQSLDEMLTDPNLSINYGNTDGILNGDSPSTGNLVNTLVQGLQSQNEVMVSTVLDRKDFSIIRDTVHNLPNEMVEEFLKKLHKLFFIKGDRIIHYYNWLTALLQEKLSVILMSQSAQQELTSLKHLFSTRCDIFDRMCALKGRLSLISSLMEPDHKDKELSSKNTAINYQESSSEEDEEEEDDNSSEHDSDRDLERIVVMDLSDQENNSEEREDEDGDEDDDDDDEDALNVDDDDADGDDDDENDDDDNEIDGDGDADDADDDEDDNSD
ncbi:WD repeat-containing protein 43-like [Panonychus citri]|uniref:WD repeat-containing protein 43-like n=1 Tax=Panonychus citri TaxID=50023 RepID=UPI0023072038|nr:WD repeat-containing protein 43-like [Panonychus citri]